jgi:hypothetical protein
MRPYSALFRRRNNRRSVWSSRWRRAVPRSAEGLAGRDQEGRIRRHAEASARADGVHTAKKLAAKKQAAKEAPKPKAPRTAAQKKTAARVKAQSAAKVTADVIKSQAEARKAEREAAS